MSQTEPILKELNNPSPVVSTNRSRVTKPPRTPDFIGQLDAEDVFDAICSIKDPEHPYSLEQLKVISEELISAEDDGKNFYIRIGITPTVPHCTLAANIALCIREKLRRELPRALKVDLFITPGTHNNEQEINRQINDKERVAAAMENPLLLSLVEECIGAD
eukprot:TRINITY_DN7924_c0_g1_i1.p1 TRINITY_DN7924_c0_g1~~TRINITY_DN7924_c0_g1_i1.p1  ORF type:complete len:162 (-),score=32.91 TRINITY_DN7924_c0_g1_i1:214-699(-)